MVSIVTKVISNVLKHPLHAMVKSKPYQKYIENGVTRKTLDNAVAIATLSSIVAKDGIGCIMYVEQSKHNKKIPEERRNFVWKLDAVNGGLMILFQILFFLGMRKFNDKLFDKAFPSFRREHLKSVEEILRISDKKAGKTPRTKDILNTGFSDAKYAGLSIFRSVTELVASTILAKRVVVPFIATYITDKLETKHQNKMNKNNPEANSEEGNKLDITSDENNNITNLIERYKHNIK